MPSFTFVSTANAVVLRGATPIFIDVRADTLNLDERLIEAAITPRTRAIVPVHYGGVGCEMDAINEIAARHAIAVIEDAAQGLMSTYRGRALGTFGALGAFSFHETKNVIAGEGGALAINDAALAERAEILWEKGTDRSKFSRGLVDKYTWVDLGSSFLPGELTAAFLWAQLEHARDVTDARLALWHRYDTACAELEPLGIRRPIVPEHCVHNGHLYYLLLPTGISQAAVLADLNRRGVNAVFHYVPLHSAPAGRRFGKVGSTMAITDEYSARLIRLPLWVGMGLDATDRVVETVATALASHV